MNKKFAFLSAVSFILFLFLPLRAQRIYFPQLKPYKHGAYLLPGLDTHVPLTGRFEENEDDPIAYVNIYPGQTDKIILAFNPGPSDDPTFIFYKQEGNKITFLSFVEADEIYIPGNGYIYTKRDHIARKYRFYPDGRIEEIPQPFYYIGIKDRTRRPVQIYSDERLTRPVARLPKGYPVEILLGKNCVGDYCEQYLVKTAFGLTGWLPNDGKSLGYFDFLMAD